MAGDILWAAAMLGSDTPLRAAERFAAEWWPDERREIGGLAGGLVHGGAWQGTFRLRGGWRIYWLRGERGR
jgi:hypothetical protein